MADDQSAQGSVWPLLKFYFAVKLGSQDNLISFQEASGLENETQPIEYRRGNNPEFSKIKMPGFSKTGYVTLKRGVFVNDNNFWKWYGANKEFLKMNYPRGRAIEVFRSFYFAHWVKKRNSVFRFLSLRE